MDNNKIWVNSIDILKTTSLDNNTISNNMRIFGKIFILILIGISLTYSYGKDWNLLIKEIGVILYVVFMFIKHNKNSKYLTSHNGKLQLKVSNFLYSTLDVIFVFIICIVVLSNFINFENILLLTSFFTTQNLIYLFLFLFQCFVIFNQLGVYFKLFFLSIICTKCDENLTKHSLESGVSSATSINDYDIIDELIDEIILTAGKPDEEFLILLENFIVDTINISNPYLDTYCLKKFVVPFFDPTIIEVIDYMISIVEESGDDKLYDSIFNKIDPETNKPIYYRERPFYDDDSVELEEKLNSYENLMNQNKLNQIDNDFCGLRDILFNIRKFISNRIDLLDDNESKIYTEDLFFLDSPKSKLRVLDYAKTIENDIDLYISNIIKNKSDLNLLLGSVSNSQCSEEYSIFKTIFNNKLLRFPINDALPHLFLQRAPDPRWNPDLCLFQMDFPDSMRIDQEYYCSKYFFSSELPLPQDQFGFIPFNIWWVYWHMCPTTLWLKLKKINSIFNEEYLGVLIFLVLSIIICFLIIFLSYNLAVQLPDSDKLKTYECGFEPYEDSRNKFDVKFCLVAILFIIFDIEIIFLIPWVVELAKLPIIAFWVMVEFLFELIVAGFYVWLLNAFRWLV